jgi:hypothetical protein
MGQSNAANSQGQRVVNFAGGRCYRAASPLLGAHGVLGETWSLAPSLCGPGSIYSSVLIPVAVGGSSVHRWAAGGDLNAMMVPIIRVAKTRYRITAVFWDQGAVDYALGTPEDQYRSDLRSLIDTIRAQGTRAVLHYTMQCR